MLQKILAALAEPTRLAAMRILWDGGEHCVCELMATLGATQSRMSRHMAALKVAGLICDRRDRQWVRYRLNPELPGDIHAVLAAIMQVDAPKFDPKSDPKFDPKFERNAA